MLEQEKCKLKAEKKCMDFLNKNLRTFIFNSESTNLIDEAQNTYEKIVNLSTILKNFNGSQMFDKIKQYENELQATNHKLQVQLRELHELTELEQQRYHTMTRNEKECLTLAREVDFLK